MQIKITFGNRQCKSKQQLPVDRTFHRNVQGMVPLQLQYLFLGFPATAFFLAFLLFLV